MEAEAETTTVIILSGPQLRALRRGLHLSAAEIGRRLGYSRKTIEAWERLSHTGRPCPTTVYPQLIAIFESVRAEREAQQQALEALRVYLGIRRASPHAGNDATAVA